MSTLGPDPRPVDEFIAAVIAEETARLTARQRATIKALKKTAQKPDKGKPAPGGKGSSPRD